MANKVFINDQDVVVCKVDGNQTLASVTAMGEQIVEGLNHLKKQHKPMLLMDDIRSMGKVPTDARNKVVDIAKTATYQRLAMLGNGGLLRIGANLLIRASGRSRKMKYFTDEEQAFDWLLGDGVAAGDV